MRWQQQWQKNREVKWTFLLHYDIGGVARLPPSLIGDLSGNNGATAIKRNAVALTVVGPLIMTTSVWVNWNSFFFIHYTSSICMFHLIWQAKAKSGFPIDKHPTILKMMPLWLDLLLFHTIYDIIIQSQTCHESIQPCMWKRKKAGLLLLLWFFREPEFTAYLNRPLELLFHWRK